MEADIACRLLDAIHTEARVRAGWSAFWMRRPSDLAWLDQYFASALDEELAQDLPLLQADVARDLKQRLNSKLIVSGWFYLRTAPGRAVLKQISEDSAKEGAPPGRIVARFEPYLSKDVRPFLSAILSRPLVDESRQTEFWALVWSGVMRRLGAKAENDQILAELAQSGSGAEVGQLGTQLAHAIYASEYFRPAGEAWALEAAPPVALRTEWSPLRKDAVLDAFAASQARIERLVGRGFAAAMTEDQMRSAIAFLRTPAGQAFLAKSYSAITPTPDQSAAMAKFLESDAGRALARAVQSLNDRFGANGEARRIYCALYMRILGERLSAIEAKRWPPPPTPLWRMPPPTPANGLTAPR
jgi:hypothetical protein